ncbi:hypothetical protein EVAR_65752_1 [Eumeta japonica]|uniref:Uncharacterized protein n=1 Tax=Eumeta variegata TaxID=151549 RepID=A0A4C1ZRN1_EUMVA|nr:hypothetical protein EVAR_65752_1 [Eumeta japonica]
MDIQLIFLKHYRYGKGKRNRGGEEAGAAVIYGETADQPESRKCIPMHHREVIRIFNVKYRVMPPSPGSEPYRSQRSSTMLIPQTHAHAHSVNVRDDNCGPREWRNLCGNFISGADPGTGRYSIAYRAHTAPRARRTPRGVRVAIVDLSACDSTPRPILRRET